MKTHFPALMATIILAGCTFGGLENKLLSEKPKTREQAIKRLQGLSPESREKIIPSMVKALSSEDGRVANRASEALVIIGEPAVDDIVTALGSADPFVKIIAANLLGEIGALPGEVVPELIARLSDTHPLVREEAIHALGRFGMRANGASPALQKALEDPIQEVREAAETALRQVDPAATKEGKPGNS